MSQDKPNVYLVGPMGSGKTTIGLRLAERLGLKFFDCDHELEIRTGASVNLIFDVEGESGFRKRETQMLKELTSKNAVLVATGGGAVLHEENRRLLKASGIVVYLKTSIGQQLDRLRRDKSRPLLQTPDKEKKLALLAAERNPVYEGIADIVFQSQKRSLDRATDQLLEAVRSYCASRKQQKTENPEHASD